jgi:tryptophan 7-halogenase
MTQTNIQSVVIVGGGSAGWMAAALLSNALPSGVRIDLVESDEIGTVGVGEATIPPIKHFNARLGIAEKDFIAQTKGSLKLGIEFVNWGALGHRYFHPFGTHGADFDAVPVHQWWLKERGEDGETYAVDDLSFAWHLARQGRFQPPSRDPRMIHSTTDYAYHFDAGLYARMLRSYAEARGVNRHEGRIVQVHRDGDSGHVRSVELDDGRTVGGELFIDCSGFRGLLIEETLGAGYHDWSKWLPCNRAWAMPCTLADFTPYTRSTQREAGWQWRIPLQHRTGNGYVFSNDFLSEDEAADTLRNNLDGKILAEPRLLKFLTGKRKETFKANVVAIGLASGFLEPLESTSLHLIQSGLIRLLALWPDRTFNPRLIEEYNRVTQAEWEHARDFLILHYWATSRVDTPMWRYCRSMELPDALQSKIDLWRHMGRALSSGHELFQPVSWVAVYLGQNVVPDRWDPLADSRSSGVDFRARLAGLRRVMREAAAAAPSHLEWIQSIGAEASLAA